MLRYSAWDGLLIALSALHGALLLTVPGVPLVALALWWNANTVSHNFIHRPFFRSRRMNRTYAIFLSALLGFPQTVWRRRHLRHHAETSGASPDVSTSRAVRRQIAVEIGFLAVVWITAAVISPTTFFLAYLPGWALGLGLCQMQGHFEHVRGTTSHYGRLYNLLFFNDGYHVEHHERPAEHWTRLATIGRRDERSSRWPPVLRWLEVVNLELLERLVLRSAALQRFVLRRHERALRALLPQIGAARRIVVVGGGLFPRTAMILRRLFPDASLTIVDISEKNLDTARGFLGGGIDFIHAPFDPTQARGADLVVVPLAYCGDRRVFYRTPPAPAVIVHDWLWARHARSSIVSLLLMKRINLVRLEDTGSPQASSLVPSLKPQASSLATSLLLVLIAAKALALIGRHVSMTPSATFAYFWQDAAVAIVFAVVALVLRRNLVRSAAYGLIAIYAAVNVPIVLAVSSPLTWPMIRATGGPLADSIAYYLTFGSLASVAAVVIVAIVAPLALARAPRLVLRSVAALALMVATLGPWAAARTDTLGLDRNAITALIPSALPEVRAAAPLDGWRAEIIPGVVFENGHSPAFLRGAARGRNVLMIALESTAARYLQPYGASVDPMPNLTRLSRQAVVFDNAYATYPESIKGLWSTLCSKYAAFGVEAEQQATVPCASIAAILASAGYRTGLFHSGRFAYLGMNAVIAGKGFQTLEDAGAIGGNVHSSFGVDEPATVSRMLAWIDAGAPREPFFLTYLPIAGHHPYATPSAGPFPATDESGQYLNALHYGDASLGALIEGLRARNLYDNTVFVIFGDHGEAFEQHPGNSGHTFFVYDENVHVPLLIAVPGVTNGPARSTGVASLIDTAPTLLDLLGLPLSPRHEGASLLRPGRRMALFLTDYSLGWLGLRDGCFKYMFETGAARSKLFDVCRDPGETADLSAAEPDRVARYRDRVQQWSTAVTRSVQRP